MFVAIAAVVIAGGAYAFTAANTVPTSSAGAGAGVVSGFVITNLHYALDSTTPANIDSLTFNVSPVIPNTTAGKVVIQAALSSSGPINYPCTTDSSGALVTCATTAPTQLTAALLVGITVVAAQ